MIVLGIDPGARSGWALAQGEEVLDAGSAGSSEERKAVCLRLAERLEQRECRVVMEKWAGGLPPSVYAGLGKSAGRWLERLEEVGLIGSEKDVSWVYPQTWRKATHGMTKAKGPSKSKRDWKLKLEAMAYSAVDDPDGAEAACIALYGAMEEPWR